MNTPKCTICGKNVIIDDNVFKASCDDGGIIYAHNECVGEYDQTKDYMQEILVALSVPELNYN